MGASWWRTVIAYWAFVGLLLVAGLLFGCSVDSDEEDESLRSARCFALAQPPGSAFDERAYLRCLYGTAQGVDAGAEGGG